MFELFNEKHQKISNDIFEYAKTNFLSVRDKIESEEIIPPAIYRNMANLGWYGIAIPEIHQGMGASHLSRFLAIEQVSRISGAIGGALQSAILGTAMVQYYGSNTQQKKWLPRFATGDDVISICITEPDSGSHILGMNTIAQRDGDDYVLNGLKCWIANSHIATVHGVIARTSEGSNGLSAFLVEKDRVGVRPGRANDNTGLRGFNLGEVIFENCRVPVINRIGVEGMGLEIIQALNFYGRSLRWLDMLDILRVGSLELLEMVVKREHTVPFLYPESPEFQAIPEVFATGYMVGLMEWCCIRSLIPALESGEGSLGTKININHIAATPAGCCVKVEATIKSIDGRQILWDVVVRDELNLIGQGEIGRSIVQWNKFNNKLNEKNYNLALLKKINN